NFNIAPLQRIGAGFEAGPPPTRLVIPGAPPAVVLICYEAIFPGRMHPKDKRPEWIATVTNDSWFGDSSGPRQHFDQARLRAIETGLPLARSANSGVSGLIDGTGRVRARIPLYRQGVIDAALPKALAPTLYTRFGDLLFWLIMAGATAAGFSVGRTSR
ncbi:MAG: apolipoprotein N-acyltransferase, partial [Pseudomonadota bacterium]